jgi:hypothetical protein
MHDKRPSDRELIKRLNEAKKYLEDRQLAFSWWSTKLAKQMYIKFVLKNERYFYVSLHQSRSTEQKGED